MKNQDTVYSILDHVDHNPTWVQRVKKVSVFFFDGEQTTESIEFNKNEDIPSWSKAVEEAIIGNEFLQALFKYGKVLDSNLGSIKLNVVSYLEITVTAPFIADGLHELQNTSDKKDKDTNMDNQQLSKDKKTNTSQNAVTVESLKVFLDIAVKDMRVFISDGKRIIPLSTMSIHKLDETEDGEEMCIILGSLDNDSILESSTTSE